MENLSKTKLFEFMEDEKFLIISLVIVFAFFMGTPFALYDFEIALQIFLIGAVLSSIYSVLALGFSLIYGVAKQLKLSLGGYYVVAAYTMYFLFEMLEIVPRFPQNLDEIILLALFVLPLLLIIGFLALLFTVIEKRDFIIITLAVISAIICGIIFGDTILGSFLLGLAVLSLGIAAWYIELSKRIVTYGIWIIVFLIPILYIFGQWFNFSPVRYFSLLTLAVMFVACIAMISDRYLLDKFRKSHVNIMIVTFAFALFLQSVVQVFYFPNNGRELRPFGPEDRALEGIVPRTDIINIFGANIQTMKLISFFFSLVVVILLYIFIWFTKMGMAARAVSQDEEAAALTGVNIRKVTAVVSGIGMGLIGFAAVLTSPFAATPIWNPFMGWWVLIIAIAIVTLGGMGSLPGSIIAAFIIGYAEVFISSLPGFTSFSTAIPFIVVILVMIVKPEGLIGTKEEMEG